MSRRPKSGEIYKHFKDKLYQIVTIAKHSETGEELVIYQALYGDYKCYARPLEMFVSEVDHEKYPQVKQKYRFERIMDCEKKVVSQEEKEVYSEYKESSIETKATNAEKNVCVYEAEKQNSVTEKNITHLKEKVEKTNPYKNSSTRDRIKYMSAEEKMMAFFDTDDLEERYKILSELRDDITDTMIDNMAVVMDVVIEDGNIAKRYDDLKYAIQTKQRYEQNTRLR